MTMRRQVGRRGSVRAGLRLSSWEGLVSENVPAKVTVPPSGFVASLKYPLPPPLTPGRAPEAIRNTSHI
jgi:hypothetical protein